MRHARRDLKLIRAAVRNVEFDLNDATQKAFLETCLNLLQSDDERVRAIAVTSGVAMTRANLQAIASRLAVFDRQHDPAVSQANVVPGRPHRFVVKTIEDGHRLLPHIDSLFEVETEEGEPAAEPSGNGNGKHEGNGKTKTGEA
jgi:hypothetical protein